MHSDNILNTEHNRAMKSANFETIVIDELNRNCWRHNKANYTYAACNVFRQPTEVEQLTSGGYWFPNNVQDNMKLNCRLKCGTRT